MQDCMYEEVDLGLEQVKYLKKNAIHLWGGKLYGQDML